MTKELLFTINLEGFAEPLESGYSAEHFYAVYATPDGIEINAVSESSYYDVPNVVVEHYSDGSVHVDVEN